MLVLSRQIHESIIIDGNITITVIEIRDGKVRMGIDCPRDIPVHRNEVQERIDGENSSTNRGD